ncbi:MAG: AAA family ATPase, partial [Flavisolibacter sp.]|nr:AAA family ATPase [Flavisolibacter sp.]
MDYFNQLEELLKIEKEEDKRIYAALIRNLPLTERRAHGLTWYPVAIKDSEIGKGDYLTIELERTTHQEIIHQLRFGMTAALFSNHDPKNDRLEGTISLINGNKIKLSLRTDELPDWVKDGKLGIDAVFDENSYQEMEKALKHAKGLADKKEDGYLINILIGGRSPQFNASENFQVDKLNDAQRLAVEKIMSANELAIVHGPPGTGKTTTLVAAIKLLIRKEKEKILVVAPSNAAVDLLSEKLFDAGLEVLRVGNPARVSEKQMVLTLDSKMAAHPGMKEIKRLKKQAAEYRDLAQKYKRNFGAAEREQRKA